SVGTRIPHRVAALGGVFDRDRRGEAVAEGGRVGEEVGARRAGRRRTADIAGVVHHVRIEVEVGLRTAEGEAGELDEAALDVEAAAARLRGGPVEARARVGAERAVLGLGADVVGDDPTIAQRHIDGIDAVVTTAAAAIERAVAAAGVEVRFETDPAADLDASVGSGNVEEPGAVDAANLHVFYWFGPTQRGALPRRRLRHRRASPTTYRRR